MGRWWSCRNDLPNKTAGRPQDNQHSTTSSSSSHLTSTSNTSEMSYDLPGTPPSQPPVATDSRLRVRRHSPRGRNDGVRQERQCSVSRSRWRIGPFTSVRRMGTCFMYIADGSAYPRIPVMCDSPSVGLLGGLLSIVVSTLLLLLMGSRFIRSGKFMPAGLGMSCHDSTDRSIAPLPHHGHPIRSALVVMNALNCPVLAHTLYPFLLQRCNH